jgi:alpha-amylase
VIDTGNNEPIKGEDYEHLGRVTDFNYGFRLGEVFRRQFGQRLSYLRTFGEGWGLLKNESALVFVDNHDTQRGHGR